MRVRALLLTLVLVLTVAPGTAEAKTRPRTDRVIEDDRITESSGLAPSLLHKNVLWTHNDSGGDNDLYAIAADGSTAATLRIDGEKARDWEAITSLRRPGDGRALLAVADIGDNDGDHDSVRIAIVEEPRDLSDTTVDPIRVLRLTYPGGPRDAEAVLADPRDGRLYIVSKTLFGSEVFAVPEKAWPGDKSKVTKLTRVARTGAGLVTDGAFLPNGNLVLRGYGNLSVVAAPETAEDGRLRTLATKALPEQEQGESLAVLPDGRTALIGSEGVRSPILRVRIPAVASEPGTKTSSPVRSTTPTTGETLRNLAGDDTRLKLMVGAGAAGLALVVLFAAAILLRPRRSRGRRR